MSAPDIVERLLRVERFVNDPVSLRPRLINPDGPEAAATIAALQAEVAALREALAEIVEHCSNTGYGNPIVNERIVDRCDETARAALERTKP